MLININVILLLLEINWNLDYFLSLETELEPKTLNLVRLQVTTPLVSVTGVHTKILKSYFNATRRLSVDKGGKNTFELRIKK